MSHAEKHLKTISQDSEHSESDISAVVKWSSASPPGALFLLLIFSFGLPLLGFMKHDGKEATVLYLSYMFK